MQNLQLAPIDVGLVVASKYELVRLLGRGAMGEVWLAKHNSLGGEFAIKLVRPEAQDADESAIARFQQEAQISAKLSRKTRHIVSVVDHGEHEGLAYLVMELLEGQSLDARIEHDGGLGLEETIAIVSQIARALGQAHAEHIVHRDLKPANVFLTKDEDGRLLVKLVDFGIARAKGPGKRSPFATGKDMVLGTPSYMSPEQARGLETLDHRCDVWALAVVAYEALTRRIPWQGETIEDVFLSICTHEWTPILTVRPDLPPEIEDVFTRAFAEKLSARFNTPAELSAALEALVDPAALDHAGRRPQSSPELREDPQGLAIGSPTMITRKKRSSGGWIIAAVLALATIGIVTFAVIAFRAPSEKDKPTSVTAAPLAPSVDHGNIPPPEPVVSSKPMPLEPAPSVTTTSAPKAQLARPVASPRPTTAVAPPPPAPTVVTPPPPPTTAAPPPPPPPSPARTAKPPDKDEVF